MPSHLQSQSISQPVNQSINQSIIQSINQSINHPHQSYNKDPSSTTRPSINRRQLFISFRFLPLPSQLHISTSIQLSILPSIHLTHQYPSSRLPLRLLLLLLSLLRLRLFFFACAFPVSAPMTAPPSVPTPGPSNTSPIIPPAPAPRKLSRDSCDFFFSCFWWWWWWCLWGRSS